ALSLAQNLRKLGYPAVARDVLLPHRSEAEKSFEYWNLLSRVAFELKDDELLLDSITKAFQLAPTNLEVMQNYAATLLLARQKPEEALKYTFELKQKFPNQPAARLNYAAALLQNKRYDEAEQTLHSISQNSLADAEKAQYNLVSFEILIHRKRYNEARLI